MAMIDLLGLAASLSLLAGWRLYLCVFGAGLAMHFGLIDAPVHASGLQLLANPWVMGAAAIGLMAEFCADKVAWLDSLWDSVHTAIRPIGGALIALALVDPSDTVWQIVALLLGGSAALFAHSAKSGTRAIINASPEPFSNIAVSTGEDVVVGGLLFLVLHQPALAGLVALVLIAGAALLLSAARRMLNRLFTPPKPGAGL